MKMRFRIVFGLAFSSMLLLAAQSANAAGFYLSEQGTPASVGTAGVANVTNTSTADAAWTNPAGMTGMSEDSILTGLVVSTGKVEFDSSVATAGGSDGGNSLETGAIPSFFYTKVLTDKTRFGFSAVAPFGGGLLQYRTQVNDELSVGFGLSFVSSTLEQDFAVRTLLRPDDGQAELSNLEDSGIQGILGLNYQLSSTTLLGLVYRSEMDLELDGDLRITNTALSENKRDVKIEWTNPQTLEAGIRHRLNDRQTLAFNLGWQEVQQEQAHLCQQRSRR